jgi:hypothetical protein
MDVEAVGGVRFGLEHLGQHIHIGGGYISQEFQRQVHVLRLYPADKGIGCLPETGGGLMDGLSDFVGDFHRNEGAK